MNFENMIQNKYVQAAGAIVAFMFVIWLVTDSGSSNDVATNANTSNTVNETHKVSTEVDSEPLEIIIEGKAPKTDDNGSNNTGEI